ncbi:restriction endonuclease subunit S [Ornithobacterium rhinotracheale]|uniref:restriction endonuclease subunit S n=1 Tax=Ornithobacterium rhinotracheale TaxID=28251 RepID=UPI00403527C7
MTHTTTHIPQGYKQTPVGIIPEDWDVKRLDSQVYIDRENITADYATEYIDYVSLSDVNMGKTYPNKIKLSDAPSRARRIARKGNILFSTVRPNLKNFAKVERDYIIASTGFSVLEEKEININFLLSFLYSHYAEKQYFALTVGSNYPALNSEDVKGIKLPIPPLAEQEKIADCLTAWDKAIEKITALIEVKKQYKKGLMQQLLTGKKRLDGFTEEWKEVKLGEMLSHKTKLVEGKDYEPVSVGVLGIRLRSSIYSKELSNDYSKNKVFKPRQLCFGIGTNEIVFGINKSCNIYCVSPAYKVFNISGVNDSFLEGLLRVINNKLSSKYMIVGARQGKSVEFSALLNHKIKIPSLEEQTAIAEILSAADREISLLEKKKTHIETQKRGLMQVLLTGKKRLV